MKTFFTRKMTLGIALALALTIAMASFALAAVWTDQPDYTPGSTVTISGDNSNGAGYLPGETVRVEVSGPNGYQAACEAVADAGGAWSCQVTLWDDERAYGTYVYTATGQTSGFAESGTFTDAEKIETFDSNCSGKQSTFNSGETVCAKATGLGNNASGKIEWWAPGASTATRETSFSGVNGTTTDTYQPTICGQWTLKLYISDSFKDAAFTVKNCDTTPPVITPNVSGTLGNNGWYVSDVSVSWTVSDPESSITSTSGCGTTTITSDTGGTTLTCSATSAGGTSSQSVTIKRDATKPTITFQSRTPEANDYGWNNSDVTVTWACSDALSGVVSGSVSQTVSSEGEGQLATGTCEDKAGNTAKNTQSGINIDKTAPTITFQSRTPEANDYGWNNSDVTVTWTCSDALSGVVDESVSQTVSSESAGQSATGTCKDKAGNTASDTQSGINIDKTAPTLNPSVSPNPVILNGSATASPNAEDSLSKVASQSCDPVDTSSVGTEKSVNCYATDYAGNSAQASASYSVIYAPGGLCLGAPGHQILQPINFASPFSLFKKGSTVPVKFRVCDANGVSIGPDPVVNSFKLDWATNGIPPSVSEDPVSTTPDTAFRWSATDQQWIFNLSTKNLVANYTYHYIITLNDGSKIEFQFSLK